MKLPRTDISSTIAAQTLRSGVNKKIASELAAYLLVERRVGDLDSILRDIQASWSDSGYVEVSAASAFPLSESTRKAIEKRIGSYYPTAKKISVNPVIDESVIGGVKLSLANQQLDLTIQSKLNTFKQLATAGKDY